MKHFFLLAVLFLLPLNLLAQRPYQETFNRNFLNTRFPEKVPVLFRTYPIVGENNEYRMYLLMAIQHRFMQFVRQDDQYRAGGEIEIEFTGNKGKSVSTKIISVEHEVSSFGSTLAKSEYHTIVDSIALPQDNYVVTVKYKDVNGTQQISFQRRVALDKSSPLHAPLPLFASPIDSGLASLLNIADQPSPFMGQWDFNKDLVLYFHPTMSDSKLPVHLSSELRHSKSGTTIFEIDTLLTENSRIKSLRILVPKSELQQGSHRLLVKYRHNNDSLRQTLPFNVTWFEKPRSLWVPRLAIEPLRYIMSESSFEGLNSGNDQEKMENVESFWQSKDPNPETPLNELQLEFYSRVDSTLNLFSSSGAIGWKTDRGKIYITHGPPHKVEDHSLDPVPNPFMRWIYNFDDRKLVFTFESLEGRRRYRLLDTSQKSL